MRANSYLQIDLGAIRQNIRCIQQETGSNTKLIPVLKGYAYGLGAVRIAEFLSDFGEFDWFAVSHVSEGIELRRAGIEQQILVMSLPLDFQLEDALNADLTLTLASFRQFPQFQRLSEKTGKKVPVSLKLDTGLHRIGFLPEETEALLEELRTAGNYLDLKGTFSHFACSGEQAMEAQEKSFEVFLEKMRAAGISPEICHTACSASLEAGWGSTLDAVRIGRRLFMDNPVKPTGRIREAVSFRAYLTDVRERSCLEPIGYKGAIRLKEDSHIGILSIGYGDGLDPALASVGAPVLINGRRASLLACCMDQSFVELGEIPASPGDEVTLFGYDAEGRFLSSQETAGLIGLEGCDLTSRLTPRVARVFIDK